MKSSMILSHLQIIFIKLYIIYNIIIKKEYIFLAIMIIAVIGYLYASKDDFIRLYNSIKEYFKNRTGLNNENR